MARAITRWDPMAELAEMRSRFDRILGEPGTGRDEAWMPAIDMVRENGDLKLRIDVPGIKPEEMTIEVEDDTLSVSGRHEEHSERKEEDFIRRERRSGSFVRTVSLPKGVDPKAIRAETRDGVLEITVPIPEPETAERITITPRSGS